MRYLKTAIFLMTAASAIAQTDRGSITGTVTDAAGAVVASAPLQLLNTLTGAAYEAGTSATGNYSFVQLPIGNYTLTVTVPGFKTFVHTNLSVQVAQTVREDIVLEVGTAAESVTVTAETSLLTTESGAISSNVTTDRLNTIPILGVGIQSAGSYGIRNPQFAAILSPGVSFTVNSSMRINGAPSNSFGIRLDGQDIATNVVGTAFQASVQPGIDAIEEMSLQTSNYAAEFGQAGGGLFNYTTRSGTNAYHGSAYDYFVNEALWAHQAYNFLRPTQRRNDWGGTIGGPVRIPKLYDGLNKTFFFYTYEQYRESGLVNNQIGTVPTAAYRAGNFATALTGRTLSATNAPTVDGLGNPVNEGMIFDPNTERLASNGSRARLQFPGNIVPTARFDTSSIKIQNLVPTANLGGTSTLINNYVNPFRQSRLSPIPSLKVDHTINQKMKASFYWSTTETSVQNCIPVCGTEGFPDPISVTRNSFVESFTLRASVDYTLTPTMLLHFGAGYLSNDHKDFSFVTNYDMLKELGISGSTVGANGGRFPAISGLLAAQSLGGLRNLGPGTQQNTRNAKPTGNISLSWVKGNHTMKFGGEIRIEGYPQAIFTNTNGSFAFSAEQTANTSTQGQNLNGRFVGFPYASFLLGQVSTVTLAQPTNMRGGRHFYAGYAQDTWKLTRKLTVDYGLRWDIMSYPREQFGRSPSFSPTVANPTAGGHPGASIYEATCNCRFAKNYPLAYAPRLGMAYQWDAKTVIRAGFGLSYSSTGGGAQGAVGANQTVSSPSYGDPSMTLRTGIPFTPVWPDLRAGLFPAPGTITGAPQAVDQNYGRPARMVQWSVGVQREIVRDLVIEASYVANRGVWWRSNTLVDYNALRPETLQSQYGLDWYNSQTDRDLLTRQVNSSLAGRFQNKIPYTGFPTASSVAQSLRPFPQFGTLAALGPAMGKTWYDSLQMKATKRFSRGLDFTWTYTFSKELVLGAETDGGGGSINDVFNRNQNKQLSDFSRPHAMVLATNYTLPKWGSNKLVNAVVADWTIGAVLQYASGVPFETPSNITNNNANSLLRGTRAYRVQGEPLFLQDLNCHCFDPSTTIVLNPNAWKDTPDGQWSPASFSYTDFRKQRKPSETMSAGRTFRVKEKTTVMFRAEFANIFNRTQIPEPSTARGALVGRAPDGRYNSGYGTINTTGNVIGERQGTLVLRVTF